MTPKHRTLMRPRRTGGSVIQFKPEVDPSTCRAVLADIAGGDVQAFDARTGSLPPEALGAPGFLLEHTHIGFLSDQFSDEEAERIRVQMRQDDHIASARAELYYRAVQSFEDDEDKTWGVNAVGAWTSASTGAGIKVAILDTGLDLRHPDFANRGIVAQSFVDGEDVQDEQGHGTHCAGTAVGGLTPNEGFRYGVASGADLYVAKVLNNRGFGRERDILTGMLWAIEQGCEVISMSLGGAVQDGESYNPEYEELGQMALRAGSLIVAAAGNESSRANGYVAPVGSPANCPSIMAVAAVDQALKVAEFSSGGINPDGGGVDIAAPGVGVFSTVPEPQLYDTFSGTSMACPHVAGVAALRAQEDGSARGQALWDKLASTARPVDGTERDIGAGLVAATHDDPVGMV